MDSAVQGAASPTPETPAGGAAYRSRAVYLLRRCDEDIVRNNPLKSYVAIGYSANSLAALREFLTDELVDSSRPACYFEPRPVKKKSAKPAQSETAADATDIPWTMAERATLSRNRLKDFFQTLYVFEDFIVFGWTACVCHLLYDVCISPLHALVVLLKSSRHVVNALYRGLYSASLRLALHSTADTLVQPLSTLLGRPAVASAITIPPSPSPPPPPAPHNLSRLSTLSRRFSSNCRKGVRTSVSCDVPIDRERHKARLLTGSHGRHRARSTLALYEEPLWGKVDSVELSRDLFTFKPREEETKRLATFPAMPSPQITASMPRTDKQQQHKNQSEKISSPGKRSFWCSRLANKVRSIGANPKLIIAEPVEKTAGGSASGSPLTLHDVPASDVTSLMVVGVGLATFLVFRAVFDVSGVYHFIRGQSLLKLYVAFNMLEIVERMWRSVELDVFDNLRVQIDHTVGSFTRSTNGDNQQHQFSHSQYIVHTAGLVARFILATFCASTHTCMHLLRGLLLCIAMNSEESAMFLIIVTNNFAEIKSTVFKKQTGSTLWIIAVGDVLERMYLCADALFVHLQTSFSSQFAVPSSFLVLRWLGMMLALEIVVDFFKHSFLIKFNSLSASIFTDFKKVLMMDVLIARCPTLVLSSAPSLTNVSIPVPSQGVSAFPCVATRRIGLNSIPILTLLLHSIPYSRLFKSGNAILEGSIVLGLTWLALVCTLIILQLLLLNMSIRNIGRAILVDDTFAKLKPL